MESLGGSTGSSNDGRGSGSALSNLVPGGASLTALSLLRPPPEADEQTSEEAVGGAATQAVGSSWPAPASIGAAVASAPKVEPPSDVHLGSQIVDCLKQDEVFKVGGLEDVEYFESFLRLLNLTMVADLLQNGDTGPVLQHLPQLLSKYELASGPPSVKAKAAFERLLAKAEQLSASIVAQGGDPAKVSTQLLAAKSAAFSAAALPATSTPLQAPVALPSSSGGATLFVNYDQYQQMQERGQNPSGLASLLAAPSGIDSTPQVAIAEVLLEDLELTEECRTYVRGFFRQLGTSNISELLYDAGSGPLILHLGSLLEKYEIARGGLSQEGKEGCQRFLIRLAQRAPELQIQRQQQHQEQLAALEVQRQAMAFQSSQGITPSWADPVWKTAGLTGGSKSSVWKVSTSGDVDIPMHPEVLALAQHCGLSEVMTKRLNTAMMLRYETFEADMGSLMDSVKTARNPPGLIATKIKEMQWGTFVGKTKPDDETEALCKRFKLDDQSTNKLTYWLNARGLATRSEDLKMVTKHLEFANKPSAKVMQLLMRLWSGQPLPVMPVGMPPPNLHRGGFDLRSTLQDYHLGEGRPRSRSRGR